MAGSEDTELRDLLLEALEKNGSLAKIRALLRANVYLAFESEREPTRRNPPLDRLLACPEGALALQLVAEFLEACDLAHTAYVYKAESRQGRGYVYEGRNSLLDRLGDEYAAKEEPVLVSILKQTLNLSKNKQHEKANRVRETNQTYSKESPPKNEAPRKEDDNCTYIVHDESGSTRSDQSSDEKNKLLLRLPLDNSDTDTSSDSAREKTHSEYIPNENIRLDADSEDDCKNSNYILQYFKNPTDTIKPDTRNTYGSEGAQNVTYSADEQINAVNSSESTSYHDIKPSLILPKLSNGNIDASDYSCTVNPLSNIPEKHESSTQKSTIPKQKTFGSLASNTTFKHGSLSLTDSSKPSTETLLERQASSKTMDKSTVSEVNYSDDFSPTQESSKTSDKSSRNLSPKSPDSESIQEEISLNGSEKQLSGDSPDRRTQASSHSSVSLSDVAEMIENSARGSPASNGRTPNVPAHKSVIVMNSNLDEVAQRLTSLFKTRTDELRMSSTKNSSEEISDSPIHSLSNISILDVHSD